MAMDENSFRLVTRARDSGRVILVCRATVIGSLVFLKNTNTMKGVGKKIRQCPSCKSKMGYRTWTNLGGWQEDTYTFSGKLIESDRQGTDNTEKWVECINCHAHFSIELVNYHV